MKENLTEIVFILDRSGSMCNVAADTIGGYNAFIEKQKSESGEAKLTTVLFDDQYEVIHDAVDLREVKPLTSAEYYARGMTALMDAVGRTINSVGERLAVTPESERPSKVIFVITTDGYENDSKEFSRPKVREMIQHQTNKYNWQFMFLGANIDAATEGGAHRDNDGVWWYNGKRLYDQFHTGYEKGLVGNVIPSLKQNELLSILKDGEMVFNEPQQMKLLDQLKMPSFSSLFAPLVNLLTGVKKSSTPLQIDASVHVNGGMVDDTVLRVLKEHPRQIANIVNKELLKA